MSTPASSEEQLKVLFEQYKLAVDMAAGISSRRHAMNTFYIGIVSGFGILDSLLKPADGNVTGYGKPEPSLVLLILPICLCVLWWLTIRYYRRINKAKWTVIYKLEEMLPERPFIREHYELRGTKPEKEPPTAPEGPEPPGSFRLTKVELAIPIVVGLVFLLLASSALLRWPIH